MTDQGEGTVAIIGSGGIGGYLAGDLADAGRDITMCVRSPFDRLVIEAGGRTREVAVKIVTDPAAMRPVRWVLLTTKAQDTGGAKPWLDRLLGPASTLVVVQNGLDHVERARPVAGSARILPAIIWCSVERIAPGRVLHHGASRLAVPRGQDSSAFAQLFAGTTFKVDETEDFVTVAWGKFLANLVANAVTALTLRRTDVFRDPPVRELAAAILAEAVAVGRAEGARLTDADADRILSGLGGHGAAAGTSMLYDRLAGRPLEHRYVTGALVQAADRHGLPVPANRTLLALLEAVSGRPLDEAG